MTDDERAGVDWWNSMDEVERGAWMILAGSAVPADAWVYFKAHQLRESVQNPSN